jgi:hypothetical protein
MTGEKKPGDHNPTCVSTFWKFKNNVLMSFNETSKATFSQRGLLNFIMPNLSTFCILKVEAHRKLSTHYR